MELNLRLTVSWKEFSDRIQELLKQSSEIHARHYKQISGEEELERLTEAVKQWEQAGLRFLNDAFNIQNNSIVTSFRNTRSMKFKMPSNSPDTNEMINDQLDNLRAKQIKLWEIEKIISVCDFVIKENQNVIRNRSEYSTDEKLELLLEKLNQLYDDNHWPLKEILIGNGIALNRSNEEREFGSILETQGFIKSFVGPLGFSGQITLDGRMHVEKNKRMIKENYDDIDSSLSEMDAKIDNVIEELRKHSLGQEIIYDEIAELKELYRIHSKKTWGQILKGKLCDIAISQALDHDTIKFIYKQLTDHKLLLP